MPTKPAYVMAMACCLLLSLFTACVHENVDPATPLPSDKKGLLNIPMVPVADLASEGLLVEALSHVRPAHSIGGDPLLQTLYGSISPSKVYKRAYPGSEKISYRLHINNVHRDLTWTDLVLTVEPGKPMWGYTRHYQPAKEWLYHTTDLRLQTFSGTVTTRRLFGKKATNIVLEKGRIVNHYTIMPNGECEQDPGEPVGDFGQYPAPGDSDGGSDPGGAPGVGDGCVRYEEPSLVPGKTNVWEDCGGGARLIYSYTSVCDDYVEPDAGGGTGDGSEPDPVSPPEYEFNPEALRTAVLVGVLESDPDALIDLPCEELERYKDIANIEMPLEVINRLQALEGDRALWEKLKPYTAWEIQHLDDASGVQVNMDHFGVNIQKLPDGMTAEQLLNHIRRNINDFVNTDVCRFTPYPDLPGEDLLWHGIPPTGSILQIDMYYLEVNIEDGSVICSGYTGDSWTFSTIKCPADFQHPVAGNRRFAIEQLPDGSYELYTSGVDRVMGSVDAVIVSGLDAIIGSNPYFSSADSLWYSLQDKVANYVNEYGGEASIPIVRNTGDRIDYYKISQYLNGEIEITELRNDCH